MYFCGRILCGNVPFTSLNGRNITFVLLRIVECTSKTKTILLGIFCAKIVRTERPPVKSSADFCEHAHFLGGEGSGMCPLTGITMNRKFPKECALKEGHKLFYRLRGRRVIQVYINLEKKRTAWKKCKWNKRCVLSAVAVNDSEIYCEKSIALNQSYSIHTSR